MRLDIFANLMWGDLGIHIIDRTGVEHDRVSAFLAEEVAFLSNLPPLRLSKTRFYLIF
jgi:hypothetical protein